jgi:hypothetical protein
MNIFEDNELVPKGLIDFNNLNKTALGQVSGAVIEEVTEGNEEALSTYIKAKALSEVAANIIKGVKEEAMIEAERAGKTSSKLGCEVMIKSGGTSYSFDHDEEWNNLNEQINELNALKKEREKKMIEATKYSELVDESGEVIPPAQVKNYVADVLTIKIPK